MHEEMLQGCVTITDGWPCLYVEPQPDDLYKRALPHLDEQEALVLEHLGACDAFISGGLDS